jgi:TRAP-type transport system small permease protein
MDEDAAVVTASRADRFLGIVSAGVLFAMMTMTFVDVIGRKFVSMPLRGAFELTELGMVVLIFAGLPLVSRKEEHVVMDFIDRLWPSGQRLMRAAVNLLLCALLCGLAWLVFVKAGRIVAGGDHTAVLAIALGPFAYLIAGLIGVTAVIHLSKAFTPPPAGDPAGII